MHKRLGVMLLGLTSLFMLPACAAGDESLDTLAGKNHYGLCASCHGANGKEPISASYPKISGQNPAYLTAALKAYRDGQRTGPQASVMAAMAKPLSDADIANLAAYIATLGDP